MTPRSDKTSTDRATAREELAKKLTTAKNKREKIIADLDARRAAADAEYWKSVGSIISTSYRGAQTDATQILGFTRDHILKQTKKHQ
ncbi:hypothetical protein ACFC7A_31610 [Streptomyces niveus]|uniref:hypothetical protein n=1 Tax=Streptomyces niveus TaxID=193462 RepID=UPI0035DBB2CC